MRRLAAALGFLALLLPQTAHAASFPWGECTAYAAYRRPDANTWAAGNAWNWPNAAEAAGRPTGPLPQVGAIVSYQPYIHGAAWTGHVGIVESVDPDGVHFVLSEMHAPVLGAVDVRRDYADRGVRFIY